MESYLTRSLFLQAIVYCTAAGENVCFQSWIFHRDKCYKLFKSPKPWDDAHEHCSRFKDGTLAHFISQQDMEVAIGNIVTQPGVLYWIGFRYERGAWLGTRGHSMAMDAYNVTAHDPAKDQNGYCMAIANSVMKQECCSDLLGFVCEAKSFECSTAEGWIITPRKHCIKVMNKTSTLTWPDARGMCKQNQSDLAIFSLNAEKNFMQNIVHPNARLWLGLIYSSDNNMYFWLDGSKTGRTSTGSLPTAFPKYTGTLCGGLQRRPFGKSSINWFKANCSSKLYFICEKASCKSRSGVFVCNDGQCIENNLRCDGRMDCSDGSDENHCNQQSSLPKCSFLELSHTSNPLSPLTVKRSSYAFPLPFNMISTHNLVQPNMGTKTYTRFSYMTGDFDNSLSQPRLYHQLSSFKTFKTVSLTSFDTKKTMHEQTPFITIFSTNSASSAFAISNLDVDFSGVISPSPSVVDLSMQRTNVVVIFQESSSIEPPGMTLFPSFHVHHAKEQVDTLASDSEVIKGFSTLASTNIAEGSDSVPLTFGSFIPIDCKNTSDPRFCNRCLLQYLLQRSGVFCNNTEWKEDMIPYGFNVTESLMNYSSRGALELVLEIMDWVVTDDKKRRHDNGRHLERTLIDFEHLVVITTRRSNTTNTTIHKLHIDLHISKFPVDAIANYIYSTSDCNVSQMVPIASTQRYKDDLILSIMIISVLETGNLQLKRSLTGEIEKDNVYLVSRVLSITGCLPTTELSFALTFTLRFSHTFIQMTDGKTSNKTSEIICGYIDKELGYWSDKGCQLLHSDNATTTCHCNHTTNFAILMQVRDIKITDLDQTVLSIITYIGCSVSLITQLLTVTVFICVGTLNSERVYVHRNLCFAIIAAQIAFLSGIKAIENKVLCSIIAVVLHYFYTAMFVWMLVEGMHLYSKVVQVFGNERSRVIYYCGFGWGVPLILVTISATADWEGYGNNKSCWLSTKTGTIWAFVGPAIAIILVNVVILSMVIKVVISSAKLETNSEFEHIRAGVKGAMFLLPLLGLTWVFGLMAVNEDLIAFQYLFAIFNSMQGFFIFMFHCAFNTEVRQALSKIRERRKLQRGNFVSFSTGNSNSMDIQKSRSERSNKVQRTYRKTRVASISSEQTSSWSPKHLPRMSSRRSTKSTNLRESGNIVIQDLTTEEGNVSLGFI